MSSNTRQSQGWWWWVCAWGVASALACAGRDPVCQGPRCQALEMRVLTWWPNTPNSPATPLVEAAEARPGMSTVVLNPKETKNEAMGAVERLLLHEDGAEPIDAFLANAGRDVLRWTQCGGEGSRERVQRLDRDGRYPELRARFEPEVLAGVTCCSSAMGCSDPGVYALPLGLHRINNMFYNVARFEPCADVKVEDADGLVALLSCLGESGQGVLSVPVSSCEEDCALSEEACQACRGVAGESLSYLIESLLLLVAGPESYRSYWRGESWQGLGAAAGADPLRDTLALLEGRLLPFVNTCPQGPCSPVNAAGALDALIRGDAAVLVMPDWFTLEVQLRTSDAVKWRPFPGTERTFLFMTDVFSVPLAAAGGPSLEAGFRWLDTLLDPVVQHRFAKQKRALPALADHSQLQLLPSLEAQLPASADPVHIRAHLNDWLLALQQGQAISPAPPELMASEFERAELQGTLRVAPCGSSPCGRP